MSKIERRIEQAEKTLNLDREPRVFQIMLFVKGPLPPDERQGNYLIHYVNSTSDCQDGQEGAKEP
jgi:hypothetical protein